MTKAKKRYVSRKRHYNLTLTPENVDPVRDWLADQGVGLSYFVDQHFASVGELIKNDAFIESTNQIKTAGDMILLAAHITKVCEAELAKEDQEDKEEK
jgi:hypothetical protein